MTDMLKQNLIDLISGIVFMYDLLDDTADFIVIYKYPGVSFHREGDQAGLFETVKQQQTLNELYPVHRLDKVTSGILIMAKTATVNRMLGEAFAQRQVEKYYLAISKRKPRKKQGLIKGDMERARRGAWKLTTQQSNPAITQFFSKSLGEGERLFLVKPYTGQTHQIRVALKSIGAPIWGDELYGGQDVYADRTYLHAFQLRFPLNGKTYCYQVMPRHGDVFLQPRFIEAMQDFMRADTLAWPAL
jgi:tRNA pseudouridine32 synthase / 23S rRNA pseudouridine746 synthase